MSATFKPGFRFSTMDAIILVLGIGVAIGVGRVEAMYGLLVGFVVFHFFLFCNVFRISRTSELIWAGVLIVLAGAQILTGTPSWPVVFLLSIVLSQTFIALEFRRPSYHGVLWKQLNPKLESWWKAQHSKDAS